MLVVIVLSYGMFHTMRRAAVSWFVARATHSAGLPGEQSAEIRKNLRLAAALDAADPRLASLLARSLQFSLDAEDVEEVIRLYERAAALGPHRAQLWVDLGSAYEWLGRSTDARRAYERARFLFPNSPEINWQLGNFAIRAGHRQEAAAFLRTCVLRSPEFRRPAFDLAWRATQDAAYVLNEVVPAQTEALLAYLIFLSETGRLEAAGEAWFRLRAKGLAFEPARAFRYLDALIEQNRTAELSAAWAALAEAFPGKIPPRGPGENLLVNGDFESEPVNGGLDWRLIPMPGVEVRPVTLVFQHGTHALEIRFADTENINYAHVVQFVPVEPNRRYRLSGYLRAEGITSDSGPRVQIHSPREPALPPVTLPDVLGSTPWSRISAEFVTGPETSLLSVRLIRLPSERFSGAFRGTVWMDDLSLVPL